MALSREDKADVSKAFGKKAAGAVSTATNDAKNKAIHAKTGDKNKSHGFNYGSMMKDLVKAGFGGVKTSSLKGKSVAEVAKKY